MTKNELKNIIEKDAIYYNSFSKKAHIKMFLTNSHFYMINKYMRLLRYEEFYRKKSVGGGIHTVNKVMEFIYSRRKNKLGNTSVHILSEQEPLFTIMDQSSLIVMQYWDVDVSYMEIIALGTMENL